MMAMNAAFAATATGWTMPFGKHRGATLEEVRRVDSGYLKWVASDKCQAASPELKAACRDVLDGACDTPVFPGFSPPAEATTIPRADFDALCRRLAEAEGEAARLKREAADLARRLKAKDEAIPGLDGVRLLVRRWFGSMSRRYHPDAGGSAEQQAVVNACYRELITILEDK